MQYTETGESAPKKTKTATSARKVMATVFLAGERNNFHHYKFPKEKTITSSNHWLGALGIYVHLQNYEFS